MAWLGTWAKRIELTISNTNVDSDLTNFPVLVYLSASSGTGNDDVSAVFDELTSDANRKKIAVTSSDGTTQLYVEIERWDDANEKAWLWVKVPSVTAASTTTIYIYFDSSESDNTVYVGDTGDAAAQSVWDSNFEGVWHMAQDPSGGAGAMKDSTSNGINGTSEGTMTSGDLVDGEIGKAIDFDGSDDIIATTSADDALNLTSTLTIEIIFNSDSTLDSGLSTTVGLIGRQHKPNASLDSYALFINADGKLQLGSFGGNIQSTTASWAGSTVFHVVATYESTGPSGDLFKNGVKESLSVDSLDTMAGGTNSVAFGYESGAGSLFDGKLEEIRISSIQRSDAWLKATYYANSDNIIAFGSAVGWLGTWAKRIEITIADTNVDSNLTDFPVLIYLSASSGSGNDDVSAVFDHLASDGNRKKIAITTDDGETQCYVEIERWDDANEKAWLWVKVPSVLASGGATLYLYYDSSESDNTTYVGDTGDVAAPSVWDSDFVGVWHMAQDPNGDAADAIKDSTSNTNDGTPSGSMTTADLVDGKVGKCLDLDGTDDYINCGSGATLDDIAIKTVELIFNLDDFGESAAGRMIQKSNVNADGWQFLVEGGAGNRLYFVQDWDTTAGHWVTDVDTLVASTWYYAVVVYNKGATGNDPLYYIDGVSENVTEVSTPAGSCNLDLGEDLWIGARNNSGPDREYDGKIDEVRISKIARSAAWIKATYYSSYDNFVSVFSSEENMEDGYSITMDGGSYNLTGTAVSFLRNYQFSMDGGSYALSGSSVNLSKFFSIIMGSGSYALSGSDISLGIIVVLLLLSSMVEQETNLDSEFNQEETFASIIEQETSLDSTLIKGQE